MAFKLKAPSGPSSPAGTVGGKAEHIKILEDWMKSYRPRSFSTITAARCPKVLAACQKPRRMGMNPHANGGLLLKDLECPDFRKYAVP